MTTEVTTCYCLLIMKLYPAKFQPFPLPALLFIEDLIKHTFWSCISGRVVSRDLDVTTQNDTNRYLAVVEEQSLNLAYKASKLLQVLYLSGITRKWLAPC